MTSTLDGSAANKIAVRRLKKNPAGLVRWTLILFAAMAVLYFILSIAGEVNRYALTGILLSGAPILLSIGWSYIWEKAASEILKRICE